MTAATIHTADPMDAPLALRYLDVVLVVAFLPFAVLADLPLVGYVVGAAGWILVRALGVWLDARAAAAPDARKQAGIQLAGVIGRAWLMGFTILAVGLAADREDGLMAAVLVFVAFTVYLVLSVILRPQRKSSS